MTYEKGEERGEEKKEVVEGVRGRWGNLNVGG